MFGAASPLERYVNLLLVLINRLQSILGPSDLRLVSRDLGLETLVELLIDTVQIHQLQVLLNFLVLLLLRNAVINATA